MSSGTKEMVEKTFEIAKQDDCHKKLLPSDIRRVCKVALKNITENEELSWKLDTLKKEIQKQGDKYLIGFITGIEDL